MENRIEDVQYCEKLFDSFYDVGCTETGGVTRLGYSAQEDQMHEVFAGLAKELNCKILKDEVGNTYASNANGKEYYLIGSHLDSVIEGGIIAGLMVMRWAREDGVNIPLRVGAFRCEESSNFGCCTIGSGLITKEIYKQDVGSLVSKAGKSLEQIFRERSLNLHPSRINGVKQYLELHIEQGKVLEEAGTPVGIVQTIAGPRRFKLYLRGMAEHSGATPMGMRCDAMCAASEIILELERIGNREAVYQSVATVGVVNNHPNALNVIPGEVELGVDIRGIEVSSLDRIEREMRESARRICKKRGIEYLEVKTSEIPPIDMSEDVQNGLEMAARRLGVNCRRMVSGAGHDAMSFAGICNTGMVFIPCVKGVSHNRMEFASITDICEGARVMYEYLKEEAS